MLSVLEWDSPGLPGVFYNLSIWQTTSWGVPWESWWEVDIQYDFALEECSILTIVLPVDSLKLPHGLLHNLERTIVLSGHLKTRA